jgi:putative polyketide hydroxylase
MKQGGILNVALCYRYPRGAVLGTDPATPVIPEGVMLTGEPGSRAPHLWLDRAGTRTSTLDLYERSLVLLSAEGGSCDWHAAAAEVAAGLSVPLDAYRIGDGPGADLVPEDGADWARAHGVTADGAVLVRPDGFVAWRCAGPSAAPGKELREAVAAVLARN